MTRASSLVSPAGCGLGPSYGGALVVTRDRLLSDGTVTFPHTGGRRASEPAWAG
ncbi:hypothetical protein [Protofrankia symbiont of Coriaria ruscifolia]|uniref:hypothetical protein n=1 Tax=Protofrankia symbiont of Coriaria ruscifolia TaxID=1306542 RepID=UPI001A952256|nr:hypothetical protein [Protofrankia symbiont of Coriaria ruscifolia]